MKNLCTSLYTLCFKGSKESKELDHASTDAVTNLSCVFCCVQAESGWDVIWEVSMMLNKLICACIALIRIYRTINSLCFVITILPQCITCKWYRGLMSVRFVICSVQPWALKYWSIVRKHQELNKVRREFRWVHPDTSLTQSRHGVPLLVRSMSEIGHHILDNLDVPSTSRRRAVVNLIGGTQPVERSSYNECENIYRLGFHIPPFNSVNHLHMHVQALPYISFARRAKYPVVRGGTRYPKGFSWFVEVSQSIQILERGSRIGIFPCWNGCTCCSAFLSWVWYTLT